MIDPVTGRTLAGFWRRAAGYLIDQAVLCALGVVLYASAGDLTDAVGFAVAGAYWIGFVGGVGATPGMRAMRMRVVCADTGAKPGWVDALLRFLGLLVAGLTFGIGLLWAAWDRRRQAIHDHIARTIVVLE